ncbi:aminotransferase class V-fold PLP-dependent enzyme [Lutispora sp.]|uniref:aminotransferase class V-fold PLP-dependent enzyme n=1 Tax=Lutispora sp. TaxID=2828727 RepID=UPI002B21279D|nr:aminotransferase class V-fold PLP-dependent enzyme [Lutispora sp.]MEA4962425.1 aminotransferase class V-fold PLP-dependent enzyme [Lutispora sp.]
MERVYLDNGATSYPKAPGVAHAMINYIENIGSNINRGGYKSAYSAAEVVLEARERLCSLFNYSNSKNVIFTQNITQSLNFIIKGLLRPGDHCIVTSMEHNAVMRPVMQLHKKGVEYTKVKCDIQGKLNSNDILECIKDNTKAVIMTHASNVCGTIISISEVGELCRQNNVKFIVDSAQTAGAVEIDVEKMNIDALAFTGHKGLLGPQGIGGFIITDEMADLMDPLISGGTGSMSDSEEIPPFMPDKFECGTINIPGIFGLNEALKYLEKEGTENIRNTEMGLTGLFIKGIKALEGVRLAGLDGIEGRTAVVSIDCQGKDNAEVSYLLDKDFGIMTRCGLHCAPSAHKTLDTFPQGTVRFSFSHFNREKEIIYALDALNKILKSI